MTNTPKSAASKGEGSGAVSASVYRSAVAGRRAFRDAYRRALPVVRAAEALAVKWNTHGQKVDSDDFYAAINDVFEAVVARNSHAEAQTDRAMAVVATDPTAPDAELGPGTHAKSEDRS